VKNRKKSHERRIPEVSVLIQPLTFPYTGKGKFKIFLLFEIQITVKKFKEEVINLGDGVYYSFLTNKNMRLSR